MEKVRSEVTPQPISSAEQHLSTRRSVSLWSDALHRFSHNALAVTGSVILLVVGLAAILAPYITVAGYAETLFLDQAYDFPSRQHWFGVDPVGRDYFSRIVYGGRVSFTVGLLATFMATVIGVPLGALAGYFGGAVDWIVLRMAEILTVVPMLLIAVLIMMVLGPGLQNVLIAIGLSGWVNVCRLTRASVLSLRERDYVLAARALGAGSWHTIARHLIPNSLAPIIVAMVLSVPSAIMNEASLSFLGIGINPPTPSWGQMINDGLAYLRYYWHLAVFPALMVAIVMLALFFVGDGARDALDPMLRS